MPLRTCLRLHVLTVLALVLGCATLGHAQDIYARYNGSCQQGGQKVTVNGIQSNLFWQQSYPGCTVTVYSHGSLTLATLFSNGAGTVPLANPFTSSSTGVSAWYAADGSYDVQYSGTGIMTPFTLPAVQLCLACTGGGGGGGISGSGTVPFLPIWTGTSALGNSAVSDDGTSLLYGGTTLGFSSASTGTAVQIATNPAVRQTLQLNASGAAVLNAGNGTTGVNGGNVALNAGSATDSTGGLVQLNAGTSLTGPGGTVYLHAGGALAGGQPAGNILLGAGQGATAAGNGTVQIGVGTGSTANPFYEGTTLFANLGSLAPSTFSFSNASGAIWCSDCQGAVDGALAGSIAVAGGTGTDVMNDGTNWRVRLGLGGSGGGGSPGSPVSSLQWNSSGSFAGVSNANVVAGTSTTPTTINPNVLNNTYYVPPPIFPGTPIVTTCGPNWSQSPSGTITAGSTTVTLSCAPPGLLDNGSSGYSGFTNWTALQVSGSGGTEYPVLTATTCAAQGQVTGCTVTFTAGLSQNAGYTIGTASGGLQETINAGGRALSGIAAGIRGYSNIVVPPGDYAIKARVTVNSIYGNSKLHFDGSLLTCTLSDTCLYFGNPANIFEGYDMDIYNITFRPGVVAGFYPALEDNGNKVHIHSMSIQNGITSGPVSGFSFGAAVQIDSDESYLIDGLDTQWAWSHCSTDFVSNGIYISAAGTAPTGSISNSNLEMHGCGNGIDNWGHNGLRVSNTQIQGYSQYAIRSVESFNTNLNVQLDNVYFEIGSVTNPIGVGQVGLSAQAGSVVINGMEGALQGQMPLFVNNGATQLNIYASACNGASCSPPYPVGYAKSDLSTAFTITWPEFGSTGPPTYTLSLTSGTTPTVPYTAICGGGSATTCGTIVTGLTQAGNCNGKTCTYSYTPSASTSAYTVPLGSYFPNLIGSHGSGCGAGTCGIPSLPASAVLSGLENSGITSQAFAYMTMASISGVFIPTIPAGITSSPGNNIPSVSVGMCQSFTPWAAIWIDCSSGNVHGFGAKLFDLTAGNATTTTYGTQGPAIFTTAPGATIQGSHILTLLNTCPSCTLATNPRQTPWNATDSFIAVDNAVGNVALTAATLGIGSNVAIARYIASNPDSTSWKERLTSTTDTFKVPLTFSGTAFAFNSPEVSAPSSPASGTQSCYASAGNGLACKNSAGTVFTMTAPGSGANYQTFLNAGSALPVEPAANFIITGGSCVDNPGSTRTDCTFPGGATVTTFSAGNLSPLFTTSVANATTTPALSFSLTNAGGGTVFGRSAGTSGAPAYTITPVLGIPTSSQGTLGLAGATSGTATLTALAAAGTPTITFPNTSGTVVTTATSPLVLNATTGNLTGPTIVTATGLTNQRIPKSTGAQAIVDGCLTDNGTQVANTCTGGFQAGPSSSANMLMTGTASNTDAAGELTLSGGAASYTFIGVYVSRPECFFRDITTPANAVTTQTVTTTTITLAGTGTDVIGYACIGRN